MRNIHRIIIEIWITGVFGHGYFKHHWYNHSPLFAGLAHLKTTLYYHLSHNGICYRPWSDYQADSRVVLNALCAVHTDPHAMGPAGIMPHHGIMPHQSMLAMPAGLKVHHPAACHWCTAP